MPWRFIETNSTDPAFNLALEEYIFNCLSREFSYFFLWQNEKTVVIGRHQNAHAEVDEDYIRREGIRVIRRLSGGGAVYHDLGNLNFTFIQDAASSAPDLHLFCRPVAQAIIVLGAQAEVNGRNDITVDGKKFSGNAQYVREGRVMHHGTVLFDSKLEVAGRALRPDPEKIKAKGVASVRSRITNLRPYLPPATTLSQFRQALLEQLFAGQAMETYKLSEQDLQAIRKLREERYDRWDWNWGASPPCDMVREGRIPQCGKVSLHFRVEKGWIAQASLRGDFFFGQELAPLEAAFIGHPPTPEGFRDALKQIDVERYITGLTKQDLLELLTKQKAES